MEILLAIVMTILVIGVGASILFTLFAISIVHQNQSALKNLVNNDVILAQHVDKLTTSQKESNSLQMSVVSNLNNLAVTIEDLISLSGGPYMEEEVGPFPFLNERPDMPFGFPDNWNNPNRPEHPTELPQNNKLTEEEIRFLQELFNDNSDEDNGTPQ